MLRDDDGKAAYVWHLTWADLVQRVEMRTRDDREQGLRLNVYLCEGTAPATLSLLKWHSYYASAYFLRLPHNAGKLVLRTRRRMVLKLPKN